MTFQIADLQYKSSTRLDLKEVLPHPTTVSRNIRKTADAEKKVNMINDYNRSYISMPSDFNTIHTILVEEFGH